MFFDKPEGRSYLAIAYLSILVGIFIAVYGGLAWLINCYTQESSFYFPAAKLMGGILIAQLGLYPARTGNNAQEKMTLRPA